MRLVLVEDDPLFLQRLKKLLGGEEGIDILAGYPDADSAMHHPPDNSPDFFIVDLGLPGMSGLEFIRWVRRTIPGAETIALTARDEVESCLEVIRSGASGYVLKSGTADLMVGELKDVLKGGQPLSARMARLILKESLKPKGHEPDLSGREIDVLKCLARELSYKETAAELDIAFFTVNNHIKSIYKKLWAVGKDDAIQKARDRGLI